MFKKLAVHNSALNLEHDKLMSAYEGQIALTSEQCVYTRPRD